MKRIIKLTEQTIIFFSILKWFLIATATGILVGLSTTIFLKALAISSSFASQASYYYFLLPLTLPLAVLFVSKLAPDAEGHGTEKVIEAIHKRSGKIKPLVVPIKLAATVITIASGGSAGKEGPCAQIGAGVASFFADILRFSRHNRKKLAICGISAGFASVFGTPIAGAIFGIEVLFVGRMLYEVLLPSFIAGIVAYQTSSAFGITYYHHPIYFLPVFSELFFIKVVLAGAFFGLCSFLLVETMRFFRRLANSLRVTAIARAFIGGLLLTSLAILFSKRYLGLGLDTISGVLEGNTVPWGAFLLKTVFTSITLSFGGSGGIVTPIFFIGATSAAPFAGLMGMNAATLGAIGLVSLLAGAANTPIAASIMAVELFGPKIAPYAATACIVSFLMTGYRSVYPSQVLTFRKTSAVNINLGKVVGEIKPHVLTGERNIRSVLRNALSFLNQDVMAGKGYIGRLLRKAGGLQSRKR